MTTKLHPKPHYFPSLYMGDGLRVEWPIDNLVCMKAEGNYTWLFWKTGQRVLSPRTLKYYEPLVEQNPLIRISRNCIVNLNHVLEVERSPMQLMLHLSLGRKESVARRRQKTVWDQIRKQHIHVANRDMRRFVLPGHPAHIL